MHARSSLFFAVLVPAIALAIVASGCDCAGPVRPRTCGSSAECAEGELCVDGLCVAPSDSGIGDGGNPDAPGCVDVDRDMHFAIGTACATGDDCDDLDRERHPGAREACGNGIDDDCDGETDEPDCDCQRGDRIACFSGPAAARGVGACHAGVTVCLEPGMVGDCAGETLPQDETCNFVDDDCDGSTDETLRNACGECAAERTEMCGNDVDDDCDGLVDEDCDCDYRCECVAGEPCVCSPPTNQPCYDGPFGTGGVGICAGGRRDCVAGAGGELRWGACAGAVLPGTECEGGAADAVDQDCDGVVDEGCRDSDGDGSPWPLDCDDTDATIHPGAAETCNDRDDDCDRVSDEGVTNACGGCGAPAATDDCATPLDDDCDGVVNDGCMCEVGATGACYRGPAGTEGVAACRAGTHTCEGSEFTMWTACSGDVLPSPEVCNGADDDCDGDTDERWAAGSNACGFCDTTEVCDAMDNDCDGLVDEHVANRCGACAPEPAEVCNGVDDDCDGEIDDGVVNACGTCAPMPCFTHGWTTPWTDCPSGTCDGIEEAPGEPGAITLGEATFTGNYIYIAVQGVNEVSQIDTDTGIENWQRPSFGRDPSRTTVALDGSVWVGNRGLFTGNPADPNDSNVVHLDTAGDFVCRADVTGGVRGVAIDADGNVWAGTWNDGRLVKISGTVVDGTGTAARCRILGTWSVGVNIYGLAADGAGRIWTSSSPTVRLDIATETFTSFPNPSFYGIAPDAMGRVWFGDWNGGGGIHAVAADGSTFLPGSTASGVTAITVHPADGSIWGSRYGLNEIVAMEPSGAIRCTAATPAGTGSNPHGIAPDRMGRLWVPMRFGSGMLNVFNSSCGHVATYTVDAGRELYSYSDMTGAILRTITTREGRWIQDFDSGYASADWYQVTWNATTPAGTGVRVEVRTADTRAGLATAPVCGGAGMFTASPADISGCAGIADRRWLRVEVILTTTATGIRPVVRAVDAAWAY